MKKLITIGLGIYLGLSSVITAFAYEDGDWQFWNTEGIEGNIVEHGKVTLAEEFRFGGNMGELYYHHTDGGLTYKLSDGLHLGLNYRQIYEKKKGEWKEGKRPHINGTIEWKWQGFRLKNRNRFEYRICEGKEDVWRYRSKLTITVPVKWIEAGTQFYLADEIFVSLDKGEFNRNRLYAGFNARLMKYLKGSVFYLWQTSKKYEAWNSSNILGVTLKVIFR